MVLSFSRRKHLIYIRLTGLTSVISLAIVCASMGTQNWIDATAKPNTEGFSISNVNYGLFRGSLTRRLLGSPIEYDLFFTCVWGENSCAWSCGSDANARETEVQLLLNGETPSFSCLTMQSTRNFVQFQPAKSQEISHDRMFTNAGLWLSTIIFMAIVIVALFISMILSIVNSMISPIETFFNIQGIYVANGIALVANILALMIYGICYEINIKEDISIRDTIVGDYSSDASLGSAYWILILPCVFDAVGIFLIAMREKIVNSDRAETTIDVATDTPATGFLF